MVLARPAAGPGLPAVGRAGSASVPTARRSIPRIG